MRNVVLTEWTRFIPLRGPPGWDCGQFIDLSLLKKESVLSPTMGPRVWHSVALVRLSVFPCFWLAGLGGLRGEFEAWERVGEQGSCQGPESLSYCKPQPGSGSLVHSRWSWFLITTGFPGQSLGLRLSSPGSPLQVRATLGGTKVDSYWEEPGCRSHGDAEGNLLTVPCQVELALAGR